MVASVARYIETFFRHKVLLILPIALALVVSLLYGFSQKPQYSTGMTVWFDSPLPGPSSIDATGGNQVLPANQAQSLLTQLLGTQDFLVKVANRGPLAAYLQSHGAGSGTTLQERIAKTMTGAVVANALGPQVLRLTMTGDDPTVTAKTLGAVVDEYFDYVTQLRASRDQASVDYYQPRLAEAASALSDAQTAAVTYLQGHPEAGALGATDPQYAQLAAAVTNAQGQYTALQNSFAQANQALTDVEHAASAHVIDPPSTPVASTSRKKVALTGAAGLLFGVLVSLLGLTALTAADTAARRREDLEDAHGGLQVVATIQEFDERRKATS